MSTADKAMSQLRAAEDKIKELEAELRRSNDRASRAEKWLTRVHNEVEQKFFGPHVAVRPH